MFFKSSKFAATVDSNQTLEDSPLLGTSRIKLTGRHAILTKAETRNRGHPADTPARTLQDGQDSEAFLLTNKNDEKQESFLHRLHVHQSLGRVRQNLIEPQDTGNHESPDTAFHCE
jgi:hypothetical protein